MFRFMLISSVFCALILNVQADLDIQFLDYEVSYYDPDYFKDIETSVWENKFFINLTITNYLPSDAEIRLQLIGATMGEYIVPTGIDSSLPLCDAFNDPVLVGATLNLFNPPVKDCPPEPRTYVVETEYQNFLLLPDSFIPNNYLTKTTIYTPEKVLLVLDCYQRMS